MENRSAPPIEQPTSNGNKTHKDELSASKSKSKDEKLSQELQHMITKLKKDVYEDKIGPVHNDRKKEKLKYDKKFGAKEEFDRSGNSVKKSKQKKKPKRKVKENSETLESSREKSNNTNEGGISNVDITNEKVVVLNHDSNKFATVGVSNTNENSIPSEIRLTNFDPNRDNQDVTNSQKSSNKENNERKLGAELSPPLLTDQERYVLHENDIFPMKNVNPKFPLARFFCKRCDYHCDNMQIVCRHIAGDRHSVLKFEWDLKRTMEHLPPPTKDHEQVLTSLLCHLFTPYHLSDEDLLARKTILDRLKEVLLASLPECELQLYGSSLTGFGLKSSDLNIHLHIPQKIDHATVMSKAFEILNDNEQVNYKNVYSDFLSKIPAIHFDDSTTLLKCAININNSLAVSTSQLLALYHSLDPRVPVLSTAFSLWAKKCCIDQQSCGTLPSYAFTLMLVHFLQQVEPPVLPVISLSDVVKPDWKSENEMSIGLLWLNLLRYYSVTFDYQDDVINVKQLEPLTQADKNWRSRKIAIEDPYSGKRNVARSVSHNTVFDHITDQFKKSYSYFGVPQTIDGPLFNTISVFVNKQAPHYFSPPNNMIGNSFPFQDHNSPKDLVLVDEISSKIKALSLNDLIYNFDEMTLTHGKFPPRICRLCQQKGHNDDDCPEEKLPNIIPLPPMTKEFTEIIDRICKEIMNQYSPVESDNERTKILSDLKSYIQQSYPDARLELFGSSCNGFGFHNSDLDICLTFHGNETGEGFDFPAIVENLAERLKKRKDLVEVTAIPTAKVPIVKFTYKMNELEADISLYNTLALHNTNMLKTYCKIDKRLQILGYTLKLFAKLCDIGAASRGSLSSYAYVLMVIYFLQQRKPAVLPVLQENLRKGYPDIAKQHYRPEVDIVMQIYEGPDRPEVIIDDWNVYFFQDLDKLPELWNDYGKNTESVGELWIGLLKFYAGQFDFKNYVISMRQKEHLTRFQKLWNSKCIAIEDPFDLSHNLGGGVSRKMNSYILKAFIKGREIFGRPITKPPGRYSYIQEYLFDPDVLTDGVLPPHNRGCFICGNIGHKIKECPRKPAKKAKKNDKGRNGRYYANSLKSAERASRGETGGKVYEVIDQFRAPDPKAFFDVSENKAALLDNATDLKRLPSTEDAFLLHLERSAYACIIDKTAHIANPVIPEPTEYGWISEGDNMIPHQMRNPSWPADAAKATNCSCKKGCQRNCSCSNASRRCNIGCLCRGHPDTCKRARLQEELEQELENESSDEESSGSSEGELED
ncbi:Terminal uridylyltransferase 7 [Nymphon striatum]|nr:Terminal uridylyltransferase 7 [Nymphon striatum]